MSTHTREHGELRQLGGMVVIGRTFQDKEQVFLIKDQGKKETASGFTGWFGPTADVWSFPGGGRGIKKNGFPENLAHTLTSELKEEIGIAIKLLDTQLRRQAFPFLVAQLRDNRIDEFAVTSAYIPYDSLSLETRRSVDQAVGAQRAQWEQLFTLFHLFACLKELSPQGSSLLHVRPQTLVGSYLWYLEEVQKFSSEALQTKVEPLNQSTHTFVYQQAQQLQVPVNNGFFNAQGQINKLNFRDQRYIFGYGK